MVTFLKHVHDPSLNSINSILKVINRLMIYHRDRKQDFNNQIIINTLFL